MGENFRKFCELQAIHENIIHEGLVFVDEDQGNSADSRKYYSQNPLSCAFTKIFSRENFLLYSSSDVVLD